VAHYSLGCALYDSGDLDGAIAEIQRAIKRIRNSGPITAWQSLYDRSELMIGEGLSYRDSNKRW